jgi:hypothetical protein
MRALVLLSLAMVMAGCSKPVSTPGASAPGAATAVTSASSGGGGDSGGGGGCDGHRISEADVQPLLSGPITLVKPALSDADSCVFATAGFSSISVTVRPGQGKQTLESWHKGPATPLPGVGDDAVFEADLKEVVATRGDTLCTVTAMGQETAPATAQTEGALCNKVFAGL